MKQKSSGKLNRRLKVIALERRHTLVDPQAPWQLARGKNKSAVREVCRLFALFNGQTTNAEDMAPDPDDYLEHMREEVMALVVEWMQAIADGKDPSRVMTVKAKGRPPKSTTREKYEAIELDYAKLRCDGMKRDDAMDVLAEKYECEVSTIRKALGKRSADD